MNKNPSNFCPLPWNHLSLEPSGRVYSCCNTSEFEEVGNVQENSFLEILENERSQKIRDSFANNVIPASCKLCVDAQKWGQISLREASLRKFPEVDVDSKPSLKYLSLRLSNQCNFACRICNPNLSTSWYQDAKNLNWNVPDKTIRAFGNEEKFLDFLDNIPTTLEILYFAGGEPFLTPEFYQILERLIANKMFHLEIILNTNFSVVTLGNKNGLELLAKFKKVSLDLSIDGIGPNGEYSRFGFKWDKTLELINLVRKKYKNISLKIFPTISIFNIYHLEELLSFFIDQKVLKPSDIRINPLLSPAHLSIKTLPTEVKKQIAQKYNLYIKYLYGTYEIREVLGLSQQIKGLLVMLEEEGDNDALAKFISESVALDKLRGVNIQESIPELAFLFQ